MPKINIFFKNLFTNLFTKSRKPTEIPTVKLDDKTLYVSYILTDDVFQAIDLKKLNFISKKIFLRCLESILQQEITIKKFHLFRPSSPVTLAEIDDTSMDKL